MKKIAYAFLLACVPLLGHAQLTEGGIQFSGVLSANVVDDIIANNACSDNNGGLTYLQLNASYKDGPFGLESQLQFGPAPAGSGFSPFLFHYGCGYLNLLDNAVFFAVGRIADLSTFGLNSFYQQAPNGVGVYGSAVGKTGLSGFGIDGIELKLTPVENLVLGILMPYNINGFPIVTQAGFFSSGYPLVTDLPGGVYTDGFMDNTFVAVYPQIKLLLGKSQHELDLGYTLAYNLDRSQLVVSQLNLMLQMYF